MFSSNAAGKPNLTSNPLLISARLLLHIPKIAHINTKHAILQHFPTFFLSGIPQRSHTFHSAAR
jgi:hypothetical protein